MAYLVIGLHFYWCSHTILTEAGYGLVYVDRFVLSLIKVTPLVGGLQAPKLWVLILFLIEAQDNNQQQKIERYQLRLTKLAIYLISLLGLILFLANGYLVNPIDKPDAKTVFLYVSTTALGLALLLLISLPALKSYLWTMSQGDPFNDESDHLPPNWPELPGSGGGPRKPIKPKKPDPSLAGAPTFLN